MQMENSNQSLLHLLQNENEINLITMHLALMQCISEDEGFGESEQFIKIKILLVCCRRGRLAEKLFPLDLLSFLGSKILPISFILF